MQLFYEQLQQGQPKDEALRNAKLAYLSDSGLSTPTTRTPFYWAPAIVIGDTSPLQTGGNKWWLWGALVVVLMLLLLSYSRRQR